MPTNFLAAAGNAGYLSPAVLSGTAATHTNANVDTIAGFTPNSQGGPAGTGVIRGQYLTLGAGGHAPDIVASVTSGTAITILTATSSSASTAINIYNYPVLIGGEATNLIDGAALTSSYWNSTGIFRQSPSDINQALQGDIWFMCGGAGFTPGLNAHLDGWFLESRDGGLTFDSVLQTPSTTVPAQIRTPDFSIPLDNAAYVAGNTSPMDGRSVINLPTVPFKVRIQNNSKATMPTAWAVFLAPWAVQL
jgi:hypothetical protein